MKKVTAAALGFFFCLSNVLLGQENVQPKSKLVHTPFAGGDFLHVIQEAALDLKEYAGAKDRVAIRVCSKEPMPVALVTATASPFIMLEYLEHYGFTQERILYLRSEDCLGNNPAIPITQFWAIPEGASAPSSVESIKSSQAKLDVIRTEDTIKDIADYRAALQEFILKLRSRPGAVGVVIGSYYNSPSFALQERLRESQILLKQNQLTSNRVFVRVAPLTGMRSDELSELEPDYPSLFLIEITKNCRHQ